MTPEMVADNLAAVRERMAAACLKAGRPQDAARLVAVTKRIALPLVAAACRAGQRDLGENRLPEAVDRQTELAATLGENAEAVWNVRWHFIGHIQSRKAPLAAGRFTLLHGVDSLKLAGKLSRHCLEEGVVQPILMQVNVSLEPQKEGLMPEEVLDTLGRCLELPGLDIRGLMGMARHGAPPRELHATFGGLHELARTARAQLKAPLPELSMGMSGDYEIAIAEGATLVRVGSAIFGPRE